MDLPKDRVFVLLEINFHDKLFIKIKDYGFDLLNKMLHNKLNYSTFKQWRTRVHFIPLWFLEGASECLNINIEELENHIIAYKGPSASSVIENPHFPLVEDERLVRITAHLLGDGYAGGGFGMNLPKGKSHSEYRNFDRDLLDSFERDLSVFGIVPTSKDYIHGHVIFPNVISYILLHIYNIKFDCFSSRLPKYFFELSKELTEHFIRAFFDDEAHVYDSSIEVYSSNRLLIDDILRLVRLKLKKLNVSDIKMNHNRGGKNSKYSFSVYNNSLQIYHKSIGFDSCRKMQDLEFNIKRINLWKVSREIRDIPSLIMTSLKGKQMTAKDLSKTLVVRHTHALKMLNRLEKEGRVARIGKVKWSIIWKIKHENTTTILQQNPSRD